ncbi:MmgE/PrpD family protein [Pigmentiphaga sp. H8]|uniref:MmgE/PrpD family protein n=1 Tax=Pigmentiphaga sp. H8 TaxID=2488560 RepID=UPI000F5B1287|nr:MmgE/PrpD family protein [Pigmentiphaga sp. H8]AZG08237.1 MmgE/PrpD family protein [Pigmentiphaga sp. H8]
MAHSHDLCEDLARFATGTRYDALPDTAIEAARKSVLDTLGVILAASGMEPAVRPFVDLALEAGGKPESTLLGFGARVPAGAAAMVNGAMAHCLDFDDRTAWGAHSGSSMIPALVALAEREGGISGQRLIEAVAVGQDLFIRLRCNVGWEHDWNLSSVLGPLSAAAAASHLLGLPGEQTANAMAIASLQSGGTMQLIYGAMHLRGMYAGGAASAAVQAVLLARKGLSGIDGLLEGRAGFLNVYFRGKYEREKILAGLGVDYSGAAMLYKPWPMVGIAHTYIHATIELMKEHGLGAADIEQIRVFIGDFQRQMCAPLDRRRAPQTALDAKFSLPFCVALAAVHGQIRIRDFSPQALANPEVLAMAARVVPVEDSAAEWKTKSPEARVEMITRDGRKLERLGTGVPGSSEAPMAWSDLRRKFSDCAGAGANSIAPARIEAVADLIERLETIGDVAEVVRALD